MHRYLQINKTKYKYLDQVLIVMQYGGKSNNKLSNIINQNLQILKILKIEKEIIKIFTFLFFKILNRISKFFFKFQTQNEKPK